MDVNTNPIERAYELARTGNFGATGDIIKQLKTEGYDRVEAHLAGAGIRRELTALARAAGAVSKGTLRWRIRKLDGR